MLRITYNSDTLAFAFRGFFEEISTTAEGVVIFISKPKNGGHHDRIIGLDEALRTAPNGTPILLIGRLEPVPHYVDDPCWPAIMGYPNVAFRTMPVTPERVVAGLSEAATKTRPKDPLGIALATVDSAKEAPFAGQTFPDVCICAEALFTPTGKFREDKFEIVIARATGRPITILVASNDIENARKKLRAKNIPYKIVLASQLKGAHVDRVIGDIAGREFQNQLGISCREFTHIDNLVAFAFME